MMMGEEDLPMPPDPPTGGGSMIMIGGGNETFSFPYLAFFFLICADL